MEFIDEIFESVSRQLTMSTLVFLFHYDLLSPLLFWLLDYILHCIGKLVLTGNNVGICLVDVRCR